MIINRNEFEEIFKKFIYDRNNDVLFVTLTKKQINMVINEYDSDRNMSSYQEILMNQKNGECLLVNGVNGCKKIFITVTENEDLLGISMQKSFTPNRIQ